MWAIVGAGLSTDSKTCRDALVCWTPWQTNAVYMGFALMATAVPVYYAMRSRRAATAPATS